MFLTQLTYKKILLIALTLLLVIPCSVKRELKQQLHIETNQHAKWENSKIACSSLVQQEEQNTHQKAEKIILPNSNVCIDVSFATVIAKLPLPDVYSRQKEKVSSYILFERFLI